ncbi:universal stress protein [Phreatobacter sp. AB_2022a]|uniref:universal stress protein n=1 Tax=Phreatobacter sp. AB_2022a TaxID=3003134 RepID=UPI0022874C99|nr:universal stress protein [Phreatobacter sp. AB_2022a]MCZ0738251.1 universal stress protein [Phreatobacter sp. AB_2022a]
MSIKTVLLALVAGDGARPEGAINYAISLAAEQKAHLSVIVGAIKVPVVVYSGVAEVQAIVTDDNDFRGRGADELASQIGKAAEMNGVAAAVEVLSDAIDPLFSQIGKRARLHDLAVCGRPRAADIWSTELAETLLLSSGRPVIVVPDEFDAAKASDTVIVAWDGSAVAARAVGGATAFIDRAGQVEIVSVLGDRHAEDRIAGAALAPMLAHHGVKVTVTDLPYTRGTGKAIADHAASTRARMVVMGGYAHSRLRQMVLGGTTTTMLQYASVPVLMSH